MRRRYLGALLSGAALPLAFAPFGLWPMVMFSLAALMLLIRTATPRQAALLGWCYGLGMFGAGVWWIQVSVHQFGVPYYWFSVSVTALFVAGMACYPALFAWLLIRLPARNESWRLLGLGPFLWVAIEWVRATLFTGFPWLSFGYSQIDSSLAGYAPLLGIYGCSFIVAFIAACLAWAVVAALRQRIALVLVVGALFGLGAGLTRMDWTEALARPLEVALIQGAVPQAIKWADEVREPSLKLYRSLSAPHWDADIVIWPETAIPAFPFEVPEVIESLRKHASETETDLLVGMLRGEPWNGIYYNAITNLGRTAGHYDKRHLVPFGEFFPFKKLMRGLSLLLSIPMSDFTPGGAERSTLRVAGFSAGVSICYEIAFPRAIADALPQAAFLINISNDAWFGDTIAPHQHLEIARMRALETGRYLLRGTNSGITAVIDHRGQIVQQSRPFEPNTVRAVFHPRSGATPYMTYGEVPLLVLLGLSVLMITISSRRQPAD